MMTTSSSSRCVTASVQAVHSFEVTSFSLLEGMGAGKFVSSRTFRAGGRGWSIRVYPDGWKEEDGKAPEYMSAFLCLVDGPKDAKTRTKYDLELLLHQKKEGKASDQLTRYSAMALSHTFEAASSYWGSGKFVEKSKLKPLLRLSGDCFTVRCALTVIGESKSEDVAAPAAVAVEEVPEPNMHQHFENMLKTGKGADVTFDVGGQIFHAHRCVLAARSAVFEAELLGPMMKEKAMEEPIKVDDMEPSIFEELLHFIYTDSISDSKNDDKNMFMQHLLVAADRYGLDRLRLMCEVSLCRGIDAQTVATTLALAEQHHCACLKGACIEFVVSRQDVISVILKTDGFKHLEASCPLIVAEILDQVTEA